MAVTPLSKLVTKAHAAEIFGVCVKTIDNYIAQGLLPRPVAFASREYGYPDVFEAFLARTFKDRAEASGEVSAERMRGQSAGAARSRRIPARARRASESVASIRQHTRQEAKLKEFNA